MEHGEKTGLYTQVLWVGSDGAHCLTRRPEQNVIDMLLVLIGDGRDRPWYRKDQMKVRHREKLGLTILKPFGFSHRLAFWTMAIAATVIADALVVTPMLQSNDGAAPAVPPIDAGISATTKPFAVLIIRIPVHQISRRPIGWEAGSRPRLCMPASNEYYQTTNDAAGWFDNAEIGEATSQDPTHQRDEVV